MEWGKWLRNLQAVAAHDSHVGRVGGNKIQRIGKATVWKVESKNMRKHILRWDIDG